MSIIENKGKYKQHYDTLVYLKFCFGSHDHLDVHSAKPSHINLQVNNKTYPKVAACLYQLTGLLIQTRQQRLTVLVVGHSWT